MVLTNFELWAADGSLGSNLPLDFETNNPHTRHLNPFDPRVVPQLNSNLNHLSSNGYYGFSYINAAHDIELNDNNNNNNININNNTSNINHNNNNNNNNSTTYNFMANDVNGMNNTFTATTQQQQQQQTHVSAVNFGSSAYAAGNAVNVTRCKKRFFVVNDDDCDDNKVNNAGGICTATNNNKNYYNNNYEVSAKRCRFDDDFSAQYCNDFFQLPSTQIATQSCLMDTEDVVEKNNNNIEKYEENLNPQLQNLSAHHQQHHDQQLHSQQLQMQSQQQQHQHQPLQQSQPPAHLYHQQQHYQDIQFATIKCHFNHHNNKNNNQISCDTLALNNNHTSKIDFEKNTENVLKFQKTNPNNPIQSENDKYDNDVANDFKVDDATLFAQLHGGCLHHHDHHHHYFNKTVSSIGGSYSVEKDVMNHHYDHLQDENYYEEF